MLFLTRKSGIVSLMRTDLSRGEKRKNYKYLGRVFQEERRASRKALKRVHLAYQRNTEARSAGAKGVAPSNWGGYGTREDKVGQSKQASRTLRTDFLFQVEW